MDAEPRAELGEEFAAGASRLAGQMGVTFGWTPDAFWSATPAELACLVRAAVGDAPQALASSDLADLMETFPDG